MAKESAQIILDLETMSTKQSGVLLSIGMMFIRDSDIGKSIEELERNCISIKLDAKEQLNKGRHVCKDVMAFWERQSKEARWVIRPSKDDFKFEDAFQIITDKIDELNIDTSKNSTTQIWQRGTMDFDMIADYCEMFGYKKLFEQYFHWHSVRDIRTFIWTTNLLNYGAYNKYAVPCDEAIQFETNGQIQSWWDYVKDFKKRYNLITHDAVSDCIIQFEQMRLMGF